MDMGKETSDLHSVPGCGKSAFIMTWSFEHVLACPLPCRRLIPRAVRLVQMSNFRNQGVIRIRVREHRADREQDCTYRLISTMTKYSRLGSLPFEMVSAGDH
jgi:hypothetical protein